MTYYISIFGLLVLFALLHTISRYQAKQEKKKLDALHEKIREEQRVQEENLPISCFTKGVVVSMEKTPEKWEYTYKHGHWGYIHKDTEIFVCVRYYSSDKRKDNGHLYIYDEVGKVNAAEEKAILQAYTLLEKARWETETRKQSEAVSKRRFPFEKLGCPEKQS